MTKATRRFWLAALAVVMVWGMGLPQAAVAADVPTQLQLTSSPLPVDLEVPPGHSVSTDLRVKQSSTDTAKLKVSLMKFGAYGDTGQPEIMDREPGDDYFDWVKFDKTTFDAPRDVWQTVKMTINVPKTAAFGYYYAVVFSRVGDDVKRGNRTNSISGQTASLVLLDAVSPNAKRILQVESFTVAHRVYEFLPAEFDAKLANKGNVHAVPHGDVFVSKGGKTVAVLPINGGFGNVLPNSKRIFSIDWDTGFPVYQKTNKMDKKGNPVMKLNWDWSKANTFRMGYYKAHLLAVYDDGKRDVPMEAEVNFWVLPWRILAVILLILLAIGVLVYTSVRRTVGEAMRLGRRGRPRR